MTNGLDRPPLDVRVAELALAPGDTVAVGVRPFVSVFDVLELGPARVEQAAIDATIAPAVIHFHLTIDPSGVRYVACGSSPGDEGPRVSVPLRPKKLGIRVD